MTSSPPVFTSRRDPDAEPFQFVQEVERENPLTEERTTETHTFTCRAQLTAGTMLDLQGAGQRLGYDRFMEQVLVPADRDRWAELIRDPDLFVGEEELDATIRWVVEQYAARPTKRPTTSPGGPPSTGSGSTDSPPATDSTSEPSRLTED